MERERERETFLHSKYTGRMNGATPFSITTLSIKTLSITTLSMIINK
jgi:hypothetical protein